MLRNLALWLIICLAMLMLYNVFNDSGSTAKNMPYSEFMQQVTDGNVKNVTIKENEIKGETADGTEFETYAPEDTEMLPLLREHSVNVVVQPPDTTSSYVMILISLLPIILIVVFFIFFMRQMQGGGGNSKAFSFGKSRARMLVPDEHKVTFADVAGIDEAKEELQEIVEFLKDPQKFQKLGGKIPKGVLLVGSPGTGKTLLARAVAGEAGVAFFSISGSDFVEMFVGVGASRIRDLFEQGKKNAPCIIFMDEIDAVGRHRGAGLGGGHDEREQTLNALLVEMDGFESTEGVILIAATNRPDVLDPALLRPGRFDRQVVVPLPDLKGRRQILGVHVEKVPRADDVNLDVIARGTPGFSGASLANLVNEAALIAARKDKEKVDQSDFEEAKDKVMMGKERRSMVISDEDKRRTANHEAGHAIVARMTKYGDPVHKVTIIPRGMALGLTMTLPQDDMHTYSKDWLMDRIAIMMGGRAADVLVFSDYNNGAGNDIERASGIARSMVTTWGMSEKVGPIVYGKREGSIFLGKEITSAKDYSEKTAVLLDEEVKEILMGCYDKALEILKENRTLLDKMTEMLLEKETINAEEVNQLIEEYADEKWREVAAANVNNRKPEAESTDK